MSQMSQFEPLDVKFRALLDPIKDLAANWDIDIADSLTDYLEELDGLRMSLDGQSNLNFAAAALLIQGSTAVYSKKVEFLHQLVQQSLDLIVTKKNCATSGLGRNKNHVVNTLLDEERLQFGTDPSDLLLDDCVEEGFNINLIDLPENPSSRDRRRSSGRHSVSGDFSRASMVLMHSVLQEDHGGSSLRMSSCSIDASGALIIGGIQHEKSNLLERSLTQGPSESSVIRNQGSGSGIKLHEETQDHCNDLDLEDGDNDDFSLIGDDFDPQMGLGSNRDGERASAQPSLPSNLPKQNLWDAPKTDVKIKSNQRNVLSLMDPHTVTFGSKPVKKGRANKTPKTGSFIDEVNKINSKNVNLNSYTFLNDKNNNYNNENDDNNTFFSALENIQILPNNGLINKIFAPYLKQIKRDEMKRRKNELSSSNFNNKRDSGFFLYRDVYNQNEKNQNFVEADCDDGDFSDDDGDTGAFWGEDDNGNNDILGPNPGVSEIELLKQRNSSTSNEDFSNNNNTDNNCDNNYDDNNQNNENQNQNMNETAENDNDDINDNKRNNNLLRRRQHIGDFDPFQDMDDDFNRRVELALSDSLNQSQGGSYENICKRHIKDFMDGAEQYARETQLSKRVADWTNKLEPILRAQEVAPEYDIHTYSDLVLTQVDTVTSMDLQKRFSILGLLSDENTNENENIKLNERRKSVQMDSTLVDFSEILDLDSNTSGEVSRIFLACLMLANSGNLDLVPPVKNTISKKNIGSKSNDNMSMSKNKKDNINDEKKSFCVRLLNNIRNSTIEDFRAPSVSG